MKRLSPPSRDVIMRAWWSETLDDNSETHKWRVKDLLKEKTHGAVELSCRSDECWACRTSDTPENKVERAHIVAKSLRGSNDPLNFMLLCRRCHRRAPDVKKPKAMFDWLIAERREHLNYERELYQEMQRSFPEVKQPDNDLAWDVILKVNKAALSKKFQTWYSKNTTWHFGIDKKASTWVRALRAFMEVEGLLAA